MPTVSLVTLHALFTEPRVGEARAKRLEGDLRSRRNCRDVFPPGRHGGSNTASLLLTQRPQHHHAIVITEPRCHSSVARCPSSQGLVVELLQTGGTQRLGAGEYLGHACAVREVRSTATEAYSQHVGRGRDAVGRGSLTAPSWLISSFPKTLL